MLQHGVSLSGTIQKHSGLVHIRELERQNAERELVRRSRDLNKQDRLIDTLQRAKDRYTNTVSLSTVRFHYYLLMQWNNDDNDSAFSGLNQHAQTSGGDVTVGDKGGGAGGGGGGAGKGDGETDAHSGCHRNKPSASHLPFRCPQDW